jgi:hypothetical protein
VTCFDNYITISESTAESRSGLYATDLPGIDRDMLDGIARSVSDDADDIWATIYKRATRNLVSDVSKNIQDKFFMDLKLISRETSSFKDSNNSNTGLSGITLEYVLPRYAKLHVISISVFSASAYASAGIFKIYDADENGELLDTITTAISPGRNTVNIDTDYEADKVFIAFDPATYTFRETENRYFSDLNYLYFGDVVCDQCFYGDPDFRGSVVQVNGGGINVKCLVYCSMEKFVCENIKLFEDCLLYKIGHEITVERRLGQRLNEFTVMTQERWEELETFYNTQYQQNVMNAIKSQNIPEDDLCFNCKNTVRTDTLLP